MVEGRGGLVQRLSPALTGKQRRYLRALAHPMRPVVIVGHEGITPGVIASLDEALVAHELIKVKVLNTLDLDLGDLATQVTQDTQAALVQKIGRTLVFYRPDPDEPRIQLGAAPDA